MRIRISAGAVSAEADLSDTATAQALWDVLPLEGRANVWGDEIYFDVPLSASPSSDARADMAVGELGYWPPGSAFCVFFGPTPMSTGDEPRAASPVNPLGMIDGDVAAFREVRDGDKVTLSRVE